MDILLENEKEMTSENTITGENAIISENIITSENTIARENTIANENVLAIKNEIISEYAFTSESINECLEINSKQTIYKRTAFYYETDKMGIVHHSNYIRWFEEARIFYLEQIGFGYDKMEELGILSPVLGVSCEYKNSVKFNDTVFIYTKLEFFNGIKMTISYQIVDAETNQLMTIGESKHCFVSSDFKPIHLKKVNRELYELLLSKL